jgi:LuxR family quorum-sensing system transcriptional regulator CciR
MLSYPSDWQNHYATRKYHEIDPIIVFTSQMLRPFKWRELAASGMMAKRQRTFLSEAEEAGLRDGVTVPIRGLGAKIALVSFASSGAGAPTDLRRLSVLAHLFHSSFCELSQGAQQASPLILLSERERDCLSWTGRGKSSWDIGAILCISENTVNFHIKNAMRKLNSCSRTVAVIRAIRLGLIEGPD